MQAFDLIIRLQQMIAAPAAAKGLQDVYGGEMQLTAAEVGGIQRQVAEMRVELSQVLNIPNPPKMSDWDFSEVCRCRLLHYQKDCLISRN